MGILDRAPQLKANAAVTLFANRKAISGQQRGLMHQAMRIMSHAINATFRDEFSGPIFLVHALGSIAWVRLKRNMRY